MGKAAGGEVSQYEYLQTVGIIICLGPIKRIRRIWFDNDVVYDDRPEQSGWSSRPMTADGRRPSLASYLRSENIEVGLGTQTQAASTFLEALIGTADCPAERGRARIVWKDLPIHKFGGRLPQMSFEIESADADANGKSDLVYILNDLIDLAGNPDDGIPGIPSSARDFSELSGIKVDGFVLNQRQEARQVIQPLQDAFMFDLVEVDYKLVAVKRGGAAVGTIDEKHLGCGTPDPQPVPFELIRGQQMETPQRVDVSYASAAIDFQTFTQSTTREANRVRRSETLNLPVVMSETAAMAVARQKLAMSQIRRDTMKVCLPFRYIAWTPGCNVNMPMGDGTVQLFQITKQLVGLFGHIEFRMVPEDPDIYTITGDGAAPPAGGGGSVSEAYPPIIYAADLNSLVNTADASFDGCNLVTVVATARTGWPGANVRNPGIKDLGGVKQTVITQNAVGGTIGNLYGSLAQWRGPNVWDTTSTLYFQMASVYSASATAASGNTGNGIIEMQDPSTSGGVFAGTYTATFTSSTAFVVEDPTSAVVGTGSVGSTFSTEVCFKITAGSTAFATGDEFSILVTAAGLVNGPAPMGSTDLDVLNGANVLVVNGEIIQFVSALDMGNGAYQLTRLLRGRRGTEHIAWDGHASGSTVAILGLSSAQRFKANLSEVGTTFALNAFDSDKANASYSNTPQVSVQLAGNVRKPWAPGALVPLRNVGTNDLALTWVYRSRWGDELANGGTGIAQLGESTELYDIEVWDSTFTTLKRTVAGLTAPAWTYTAAMQVTDFGAAPQSPVGIIVYQVSPLVGRGFPGRLVVTV